MVLTSSGFESMFEERTEVLPYRKPQILNQQEYADIRQMCSAAVHTTLLNTDSVSEVQRLADALVMAIMGWEMGVPVMTSLRHMYKVGRDIGCNMQLMMAIARRGGVQFQIPDTANVKEVARVGIKRPDANEFSYFSYSLEMAGSMGLLDKENWKTMPSIMLTWRAVGLGIRFEIPDIVSGMYPLEELMPDQRFNETGAPVGQIIAYNGPKPTNSASASTTRPPQQRQTQPPPEKKKEEAPPVWPSEGEAHKLVGFLMERLTLTPSEILNYAGIKVESDISVETGWGKWATAKDAAIAIKEAMEKHLASLPPATPKIGTGLSPFGRSQTESPDPASAAEPANPNEWTVETLVNIDVLVESNFFDLEAQLPMTGEDMLAALKLTKWTDVQGGFTEAKRLIHQHAFDHQLPLIMHTAEYIKANGAHYVLRNRFFQVRLYGSDQLRDKGPMWTAYIETLKDGEEHDFEEDKMPDLVVAKWKVQKPKTEGATAYNIVMKDGIIIPNIEF